jgi:hypothetical protein
VRTATAMSKSCTHNGRARRCCIGRVLTRNLL